MDVGKKLVAIAGGSSASLGRSIVNAVSKSPNFRPIILSRAKLNSHPVGFTSIGYENPTETRYVDYHSVDSLVSALTGVHTVLSVIFPREKFEEWFTVETNLLKAARLVGTKRFAPSEFLLGPLSHKMLPLFEAKAQWWDVCKKVAMDAHSKGEQFEIARFHTGLFMNYLGMDAPYDNSSALGGRSDQEPQLYFHIGKGFVEIPQTAEGKSPRITMTTIEDIGRFVCAAVELPEGEWEEDMGIAGDTLYFDEIVMHFEAVTGEKLSVKKVCSEEYKQRIQTAEEENDFYGTLVNMFKICHGLDQDGVGVIEPTMNRKFPQIVPVTVKAYLEKFWGGKQPEHMRTY